MISVETTQSGAPTAEWAVEKDEPRSANWDPASFEEQLQNSGSASSWKHDSKNRNKQSRLQDISFEFDSAVDKEQPWPFDSSPCAWRAKVPNTNEKINQQLYDLTFVARNNCDKKVDDMYEKTHVCPKEICGFSPCSDSSTSSSDKSGGHSFCGDIDDASGFHSRNTCASSSRRSQRSDHLLKLASGPHRREQSYYQTLAWNRRTESMDSNDALDCNFEYSPPTKPSGSRTHKRSGSETNVRKRIDKSNQNGQDPLAASCHGQIETKIRKNVRRKTTRDKDALSATCHGQIEQIEQTVSKVRRSSRRPKRREEDDPVAMPGEQIQPVQTIRNDNVALSTSSAKGQSEYGADLGGASVHGTVSISRVRSNTQTRCIDPLRNASKRKEIKVKADHQGQKSRGMPTVHNQCSEESSHGRNVDNKELNISRSSGRHKMRQERSSLQPSAAQHQKPVSSRILSNSRSSRHLIRSGSSKSMDDSSSRIRSGPQSASRSTSFLEPKDTQVNQSSDRIETDSDEEFAIDGLGSRTKDISMDRLGSARSMLRRRPNIIGPRRDLLVLLKEKKAFSKNDFMNKENRRLLHFITYERQMGVSMKALHRTIKKEMAETCSDLGKRGVPIEKVVSQSD
ncbi:predicted protein [Phaeodactylum tricornutum CCAP 1055/1]|uniref:Uncharacterized protein n=1 Tax=Phaeodactylum tricornutum (strain CCAP 1055/1) TaxID=556484 RepID=B7GB70_PHATC|nr:predicted protein [Phaeodactylum tricornutum CCAP 1055/1]EEC44065.1 predicted protein [Phaeodactylum tricornutum CCAP 1055/1]|eukprot:XP_002184316.1 predicted protein [Phaeodactylum tricornutum CCAP 1055/1]